MRSTPRSYFETIYAQSRDPWDFETSSYERRKYELTLAALPKHCYTSAFEPGCSVGVLTEMLSARCRRLLATDLIGDALERASARLKPYPHVQIEEGAIPEQWPDGVFDLVVFSEIAYYFDEPDLRGVMDLLVRSTLVGAHLVAVHWRGETDYPLSGLRAHEVMSESRELRSVVHHDDEMFILDVWERTT